MVLIYVLSQGAFAVMHITAYGGSALNILVAFLAGCVFLALARQFRPEMSQGLHTGINYVQLGLIGI
jgi:hypothetical protein